MRKRKHCALAGDIIEENRLLLGHAWIRRPRLCRQTDYSGVANHEGEMDGGMLWQKLT